ncbi:TIGR03943 family putative permease subunit [Iningainema tapete]|uniref:TIGR03943 family protein n=1 Tax=Iningainema tapete BLCC-T55 TaxID=2748662 RepID=A0A8J6XBF4_9CYAN|nr:TIGR03943 family protein [Iningainema tapete]MBD2772100.1 TIGR03943 family protein [Iningainema tapete BLCC-T55]
MTKKSPHFFKFSRLLDWLDVLAITAWGILLLKYWLTEKLVLLVHPKHFWLVIATGFALLFVAVFRTWVIWRKHLTPKVQHLSQFPPGWGSGLLLLTALLGLLIVPHPLTSQAAMQQEVANFSTLNRNKIQAFRASTRPEDRSLVDWVKTLAVYPEPDVYIGQKAKVQGFVVHLKTLPDDFLVITRFVITHCALDASPAGLPVKLTQSRQAYPLDTWLEIEGKMITAELEGKRQLTIQAKSIKPIPEPKNPYEY